MVFIERVSELYSYQVYPYYCILLALALEHFSFKENTGEQRRPFFVSEKKILIGLMLLFVTISSRAIHYKLQAYIREGQYGKILLQAQLNRIPLNEFQKLCRTKKKEFYSTYYMTDQKISKSIQENLQVIYGVPYLNRYECWRKIDE